jgi:hypothetical protein
MYKIHVRNVWNFAALLTINFIYLTSLCQLHVLQRIISGKPLAVTTTHIPALAVCLSVCTLCVI